MNAPGVLAVLDRVSMELRGAGVSAGRLPAREHRNHLCEWGDDIHHARAAVAELEKRGNALVGGARHRDDGRWVVQREDFEAFRAVLAALAACGKGE